MKIEQVPAYMVGVPSPSTGDPYPATFMEEIDFERYTTNVFRCWCRIAPFEQGGPPAATKMHDLQSYRSDAVLAAFERGVQEEDLAKQLQAGTLPLNVKRWERA